MSETVRATLEDLGFDVNPQRGAQSTQTTPAAQATEALTPSLEHPLLLAVREQSVLRVAEEVAAIDVDGAGSLAPVDVPRTARRGLTSLALACAIDDGDPAIGRFKPPILPSALLQRNVVVMNHR